MGEIQYKAFLEDSLEQNRRLLYMVDGRHVLTSLTIDDTDRDFLNREGEFEVKIKYTENGESIETITCDGKVVYPL